MKENKNTRKYNMYLYDLILHLKLNPKKFANSLGYERSDIVYNVLREENGISTNLASKIVEVYPNVNYNWLLSGEGEMLKSQSGAVVSYNQKTIPLYDVEASGGFGTFDSMIAENKVLGEFVIPTFSSAEWMIYVKGSSMYPKYSSGDIIACKVIKESKFIQWNKVYVLATSEQGLLVKRLMPSEKENHIKAVSDNKDYPAFDVPNEEILGVALVLGVIRLE